MAERKLNDNEIGILARFYTGISAISTAALAHGDGLTLENARVLLNLIEQGCQATAEGMRAANPEQYSRVEVADDIGAEVIELDAYRANGGLLN